MSDRQYDLHIVGRKQYSYYAFPIDLVEAPKTWSPANDLANSDAIFLTRAITGTPLEKELQDPKLRLLPVISLYGTGELWHDHICSNPTDPAKVVEAFDVALQIIRRIEEIPAAIKTSSSLEDYLLAHIYTRSKSLTASYAPNCKEAVSYPIAVPLHLITESTNRLVDAALLTRHFFDRLHLCSECGSSRLNVREECVACRSAHIAEEHIIHHYKCGHEARESAFRTPSHFQCPKCGEALRHIGLDYDKPGILIACNTCGHMTDASAVGFVCMDCGATSDSDRTATRDWYTYELTALGTQKLLSNDTRIHVHRLPVGFATLLRQALLEEAEFNTPFVMLRLSFAKKAALEKNSPAVWMRLKSLIYDCIRSGIRTVDVVCEYGSEFLLLFPRARLDTAMSRVEDIRMRVQQVLKHDPDLIAEQIARNDQMRYLSDIERPQSGGLA